MKTKDFLHNLNDERLEKAIVDAESRTSAEIRVFISEAAIPDPLIEAEKLFLKMGMQKTALRNAVLIFVAPVSQKFSIVGDTGIHQKCGENFWRHIVGEITPDFKEGRFTDGIIKAVAMVGERLAQHFPRSGDDQNELPNKIERG